MDNKVADLIGEYYEEKLRLHGTTAKGVDWKDESTQELRFSLLTKVFGTFEHFDVNDLGCGYGALGRYLLDSNISFNRYHGYDISQGMIEQAKASFKGDERFIFKTGDTPSIHEFSIASGIFNVKLGIAESLWEVTVRDMLRTLHAASSVGFAFNMLDQPTDQIFRRENLYYAHSNQVKKYCLEYFGKTVKILSHEKLYEFTVIVTDLFR